MQKRPAVCLTCEWLADTSGSSRMWPLSIGLSLIMTKCRCRLCDKWPDWGWKFNITCRSTAQVSEEHHLTIITKSVDYFLYTSSHPLHQQDWTQKAKLAVGEGRSRRSHCIDCLGNVALKPLKYWQKTFYHVPTQRKPTQRTAWLEPKKK